MANFNNGYKAEFTQKEADAATAIRDELLNAMAELMHSDIPPQHPQLLALVERYRFEFIDKYLYRSTPVVMLGLSTVLATDPRNRAAYERYAAGLADYLAAAFRAYYDSLTAE